MLNDAVDVTTTTTTTATLHHSRHPNPHCVCVCVCVCVCERERERERERGWGIFPFSPVPSNILKDIRERVGVCVWRGRRVGVIPVHPCHYRDRGVVLPTLKSVTQSVHHRALIVPESQSLAQFHMDPVLFPAGMGYRLGPTRPTLPPVSTLKTGPLPLVSSRGSLVPSTVAGQTTEFSGAYLCSGVSVRR